MPIQKWNYVVRNDSESTHAAFCDSATNHSFQWYSDRRTNNCWHTVTGGRVVARIAFCLFTLNADNLFLLPEVYTSKNIFD